MTRARKIAVGVVVVIGALAGAVYTALRAHPHGDVGPEAEHLARALYENVRGDRWQETQALKFTFRGMRAHVWDRARGFAYVTNSPSAPKEGALEVWLDVMDMSGVVKRGGVELTRTEADQARAQAWAWHCNDTFWLNPVVKIFDEGVERSRVFVEGDPPMPALAVNFASGGVTPGDAYVWRVEWIDSADGPLTKDNAPRMRPVSLAMWVSARPLSLFPGITWTWDGWQELATGARVATHHVSRLASVDVTDVHGARTLTELPGPLPGDAGDPFATLQARRVAAAH